MRLMNDLLTLHYVITMNKYYAYVQHEKNSTLSFVCLRDSRNLTALVKNSTTLLSLCREICLLARHLHKTFNTFYNKTSAVQ